MPNKSSSVFGGSHGRWEFGQPSKQTIMSSHRPKEEQPAPVIPVPDSNSVNMSFMDNQNEITEEQNQIVSDDLKVLVKDQNTTIKTYVVKDLGTIVQIITHHRNGQITDTSVWVPFSEVVDNKIVAISEEEI